MSDALADVLSETMTEGVPMCVDCGFQPYCGSDPVYHHATQGDVVGFKPSSDFCRKNMAVMRHLIRLLEDDEQAASVLRELAVAGAIDDQAACPARPTLRRGPLHRAGRPGWRGPYAGWRSRGSLRGAGASP